MSDFLETRYERDPSVVYREIAGEAVLVPIRQSVADFDSIYNLRGTGAFIWELLDGKHSLRDIKTALLAEYEVEPAEAEADLVEFTRGLEEIGAVRVVS